VDGCRVGIGRSEITPDEPGPTMGWGRLGRADAGVPRDRTDRLYVTALALEDSRGKHVVLVNADLHCGGLHLWRAAVDASGLHPSRVVLCGTHTHAGPGQRYGGLMYTLFAGPSPFAPWASSRRLARSVRAAVRTAMASLAPGGVVVMRGEVGDVASNRAVPAWNHNDAEVREAFVAQGPGSTVQPDAPPADRFRDPRLTVLVARPDDGSAPAALAWYAVHGTSLGADWPTFGADLWGFARAEAERDGASVGYGGGSSGDISPLPVDEDGHLRAAVGERPAAQGRALAEHVGRRIGAEARALIARADVTGFSLATAHEEWRPRSSGLPRPLSGLATAGGGVDGTTGLWAAVEAGIHAPRYRARARHAYTDASGQGPKISVVKAYTTLPLGLDLLFALLAPRCLPLHVIRVGEHVFATVPGEATTLTGWLIERAVVDATSCGSASVIGFAGDYGGYWVTAEEYLEQRYEAASTIYGRHASVRLSDRLASLAATLASPGG
jgi:neutral ceramidase